jgi:two-component system response regulator VicR
VPNTTVLIVDNDSTDLKIFKGLLNGGFNSHCLEDSTKTIEQIEDLKPDVLIVDILMPDKDGYEILEEVKQKYPGLPVIATTAGATLHRDVYLEAAKALGADAILEKPIQKEKLLKVLDKLGQVAK